MKETVFKCRSRNYRIVMKPRKKVVVNGMVVEEQGKAIKFSNFVYSTSDKEEIDCLNSYAKRKPNFIIDVSKVKEKVEAVEDLKKDNEDLRERLRIAEEKEKS